MRHLLFVLLALMTLSACATTQVPPVPFPMTPHGSVDEPLVCAKAYAGSAMACAQVVEDDLRVGRRNPG